MACGVEITNEDGAPIKGVTSLVLHVNPGETIRAEIGVCVRGADVLAHPLLDLSTVEASAAAHGYRLVQDE